MDTVLLKAKRVGLFLRLVLTRFVQDQGLPNAASLTFATLLSLVPLMTVSLAVFSAFPIAERVSDQLQDFIFANFVPASSEVLQAYLQNFSSKASRLTGTGFAFLVVVALMLMANIDRAFNTIWRVQRKRSALSMFVVYWSILSLGPLLIGLSVVVTSYLISIPLLDDVEQVFGLGARLLALTPMLASVVAFTLLYAVVPNRRVSVVHALAGGVLAALLFELAKRGFAFYITQFPAYEAIYGALAVIPIFLVWIYLCWVVTLLGAEFACCLGIFKADNWSDAGRRGGNLLLAIKLMEQLWRGQEQGVALSIQKLSKQLGGVPEERLDDLLWGLADARLVLRTEEGGWALARNLSDVTLWELYQTRAFSLPTPQSLHCSDTIAGESLLAIIQNTESYLRHEMSTPLAQLFKGSISKQS
ncbi:MAG: virulence factor BrkB family protein [Chromatiales bacterium]|nr:virulence factor BrkB family protein [Chromatiales bacterium]